MKKSIFFFVLFFYIFSNQTTIFAAGSTSTEEPSVYEAIHKDDGKPISPSPKVAETQSPSLFPLFIKFIVSFALVIGLLFLLFRFLSKRSSLLQSSGPVLPLGGQVLGNNRSLQVVHIGQTIYIIGVGETITLINSISHGEEYQQILKSYENQADGLSENWLSIESKKKWSLIFQKFIQNLKKENRGE